SSVTSIECFLALGSAAIGLELIVELMGGEDVGITFYVKAVLRSDVREDRSANTVSGIRRFCEPEIGDDPGAQQIVAEVAEGAVVSGSAFAILVFGVDAVTVAAIHGVAVGGESPVHGEIWRGHVGKAGVRVIGNAEARSCRRQRANHVSRAGVQGESAIGKLL